MQFGVFMDSQYVPLFNLDSECLVLLTRGYCGFLGMLLFGRGIYSTCSISSVIAMHS